MRSRFCAAKRQGLVCGLGARHAGGTAAVTLAIALAIFGWIGRTRAFPNLGGKK